MTAIFLMLLSSAMTTPLLSGLLATGIKRRFRLMISLPLFTSKRVHGYLLNLQWPNYYYLERLIARPTLGIIPPTIKQHI